VFRSLLVDNWMRFFFNPALGALGGLVGWALFTLVAGSMGLGERAELAVAFGCMGLCVGFACNMLKGIQDGAGALRVIGTSALSGVVGAIGGVVAALLFSLLAEVVGLRADSFVGPLVCYLFVGTIIGLSSRMTSFDKFMGLAAVGGLLGGLVAGVILAVLDTVSAGDTWMAALLVPMSLGFGIGVTTYSFPAFVSGGSLRVLTGQFKGQTKEIENDDIVVGNNKRQLQWVLPKWEGVQDPHARIEVKAEGKGYKHLVKNAGQKTVMVVRDGKKTRVKPKQSHELQDGDTLVFATGKNYVKVRYSQRTAKE